MIRPRVETASRSPEPPSPEGFSVAACGPEERAEQVALYNRCFRKPIEPAGLRWRYDENPHGRTISFVCRPEGHPAVSGYACNPRRALAFGREETLAVVGETGDVMTDPDWRKRGLFSGLDRASMKEAQRQGWPFAFGFPNHRSAHIFLELGWERIGTCRPWTLLLSGDVASRRSEGRLRALLAPLQALAGKRARARLARSAAPLEARPLERFPREVLDVARRVEPRFAFMVRRDPDYLDWRFLRSPSGLHRALGLYDAAGDFRGYVVVQVPRPGESTGFLVDVLAAEEAEVDAAFLAGLAALERSGARAVKATAVVGSWWEQRLRGAGFAASRPEATMIVILHAHGADHPLTSAAREAARWYFTDGDRDDETMG